MMDHGICALPMISDAPETCGRTVIVGGLQCNILNQQGNFPLGGKLFRRGPFTRNDAVCMTLQVSASTFGSVPLRTYLPDGDIDISIFVKDPDNITSLKDTWAQQLQTKLDEEGSNPVAPFKICDVQIINAEVGGLIRRSCGLRAQHLLQQEGASSAAIACVV